MSSTFRIILRGLCAFVPEYDGGTPKSVSVFLPYAMRPREETKGENFLVPTHTAVLVYDPKVLHSDSNTTPHVTFTPRDEDERAAFCLLGNELIIHRRDGKNTGLELPMKRPKDPLNPDDQERKSLYYLLHLRELLGNSSKRAIKSKFLKKDESVKDLLSARIQIDHGRLYVHELDMNNGYQYVPWHWHDPETTDPQRTRLVAVHVGLELKEVTRPVEIRLRKFDDQAYSRRYVFSADRDVEVTIAHSEPEKIFGLPSAPPHVEESYVFDLDMRGYIQMAAGAGWPNPWRDLWCEITQFGGLHGVCKSVMLDHPDST